MRKKTRNWFVQSVFVDKKKRHYTKNLQRGIYSNITLCRGLLETFFLIFYRNFCFMYFRIWKKRLLCTSQKMRNAYWYLSKPHLVQNSSRISKILNGVDTTKHKWTFLSHQPKKWKIKLLGEILLTLKNELDMRRTWQK